MLEEKIRAHGPYAALSRDGGVVIYLPSGEVRQKRLSLTSAEVNEEINIWLKAFSSAKTATPLGGGAWLVRAPNGKEETIQLPPA